MRINISLVLVLVIACCLNLHWSAAQEDDFDIEDEFDDAPDSFDDEMEEDYEEPEINIPKAERVKLWLDMPSTLCW